MKHEIKQRIEQIRRGIVPEGYKKTQIGIVPKEWNQDKFANLFSPTIEFTDDTKMYPLHSLTIEKGVIPKSERYEREYLIQKTEDTYKVVREDQFVYNPMNLRFGAVARYKAESPISVSGYYDVFSCKDKHIAFMEFFLKSNRLINFYNRMATGSLIEKQRVHFSQFLDFELPLPSINECEKIAEILLTWDKGIELRERLIEEKRRQKKYLLQKLLTGEKRIPGFRDKWRKVRLGEVCKKVFGGGTPSRNSSHYYQGNIPWVTVKDLDGAKKKYDSLEHISEEAVRKSASKIIPKGNLIVSTRMGLGRGFINMVDMAINQDMKGLILDDQLVFPEFLYYCFIESGRNLERLGNGSTVKGIDLQTLLKVIIHLPTLPEQIAIAEILSVADREIELLENKFVQIQRQKEALMQLLLTGIVRVNVQEVFQCPTILYATNARRVRTER
ncbi:restriction endonuclease subunit S [Desulforamulus aeronauticus]|uniref:restriction endonuclease subunit S n=1 Tax=Desulforamulus aeronauticus TaxID=53343 RepID=UPI001114EA99|nr:restriction endonuclease subunit S [Desulforamulus aeronauticus]